MNEFARWETDDGFTSVTFMLMLLVLIIAVGALSVDLWHLVAEHREVAGVVDGAAISAASAVDTEALRGDPPIVRLQPDQAMLRACSYLQANGGIGTCPGPEVEIVVGLDAVSITMRRHVSLTLLKIFTGLDPEANTSAIEVGASSTASIASR